jgi:hypothetical protein
LIGDLKPSFYSISTKKSALESKYGKFAQ